MFQRLKGAIDSRIAEEQARQRQAQLAAQGRSPARRRPQNPNGSSQRPSSKARDSSATAGEKQPDPGDFVIGDDDNSSTPAIEKADPLATTSENEESKIEIAKEKEPVDNSSSVENAEVKTSDANGITSPFEQATELPLEVRTKLRKLEKLESKYGELLKAYRTAHARVQTIEPFESSLRENTPLTGIGDPSALVEYLNQVKLKGDMVLDELKRVTAEKDDFKKRLEQSEKDTTVLRSRVEELQEKVDTAPGLSRQDSETNKSASPSVEPTTARVTEKDSGDAEGAAKSPPSSRIGSFSIFSPKLGASKEAAKDTSEDLFSYDSEVPRLEHDLEERTAEVVELKTQVTSLKTDLSVARESTSGMAKSLEAATHELHALRDEKEKFETAKAELEKTLQSKSMQIDDLQKQIEVLRTHESGASAEIQALKDKVDELERNKSELQAKFESQSKNMEIINDKLSQKDAVVKDLEDSLSALQATEREQTSKNEADKSSEKKLVTMQGIMDNLRNQLNTAERIAAELKNEIQTKQDEFAIRPSTKIFGFLDDEEDSVVHSLKSQDEAVNFLTERFGLRKETQTGTAPSITTNANSVPSEAVGSTAGGKKKNKKKKKGGKGQPNNVDDVEADVPIKVSEDLNDIGNDAPPPVPSASASIEALEEEVAELKRNIEMKDANIGRLSKQIKDQETLQEEIETLRDDLLHQGQGHVEAREALKEAQDARKSLQEIVERLEKEITESKQQIALNAESEQARKELDLQFKELQSKSDTLQKDLGAAESLAAARFKDISDLKELLSKAQPELRQLRSEMVEMKSAKEDLKNKEGELKRLEGRHEDLKSEMKGMGKRLSDKDAEIKDLQTKVEQETKAKNRIENELSSAQLDARVAENKRKDTSELLEQRQKDLSQAKEEASNLRKKISDLENKVSDHSKEISTLKDEVGLKTALHSSSQSLLQSLRDQTHELSMQARESSARAESLEEELAETQRMLSERTRESQTMRMLLDQAQNGVEARIRDMKERMEAATEERDRIEDEANVRDRRLMREVEDAKNKMRDAQKQLKNLEDERDELETKSREWRRAREDLEQQAQDAKKDVEDIRQAMKGLRDALDESERQIREVETQKADMRRQVDETNERIEKLTKANKNLSEEIKKLQEGGSRRGTLKPAGATDSGVRSSRTSTDSTRSPAPPPPLVREPSTSTQRSETPTGAKSAGNVGLSQGTVDYVYLKNVLLQFMEQKDKSHQRQLIPVLAMLLHFDRKDEQKWMAAITSK